MGMGGMGLVRGGGGLPGNLKDVSGEVGRVREVREEEEEESKQQLVPVLVHISATAQRGLEESGMTVEQSLPERRT